MADLSELRDDAGRLEAEKVREKVTNVLAERPARRVRTPSFDGGARTTPATPREPGLSHLLGKEMKS